MAFRLLFEKVGGHRFQNLPLQRHPTAVIHQRRFPQALQFTLQLRSVPQALCRRGGFEFRRALDVQVELIPEAAAQWSVRAGVERRVEKRGEQGKRPHQISSPIGNPLGNRLQVGKVSAAPASLRMGRI